MSRSESLKNAEAENSKWRHMAFKPAWIKGAFWRRGLFGGPDAAPIYRGGPPSRREGEFSMKNCKSEES